MESHGVPNQQLAGAELIPPAETIKTLAQVGEKRFIADYVRPLFAASETQIGIGDDAAITELPGGAWLVSTIDKIPEVPVAFTLGLMSYRDMGYYLIVANLSDLASMGATPAGLLLLLALPGDTPLEDARDVLEGVRQAAAEYSVPVVGGDTGASSTRMLAAAAFGTVPPGRALLRSAASVGDHLYVSGYPGVFATAHAYFLLAKPNGHVLPPPDEHLLTASLIRPQAQIALGHALLQERLATACQDVTDGLARTLRELCAESNIGAVLDESLFSYHSTTHAVATFLGAEPRAVAFGPGADFHLLFASPYPPEELNQRLCGSGLPLLSHLGRATPGNDLLIRSRSGTLTELPDLRWEHFSGIPDVDFIRQQFQGLAPTGIRLPDKGE